MGHNGVSRVERWAQITGFGLYVGLIIFLSLSPSETTIKLQSWDKVGHLLAYTVMVLVAFLTFSSHNGRIVSLIFIIGLGLLLEWLQSFVPGRLVSWNDALANGLGVLLGLIIFRFQERPLTRLYEWMWSIVLSSRHHDE